MEWALVRAENPGPFTLSGTNTWLIGRDPCWIVDPGPALPEHVDAVAREAERLGGAAGIALTHGHADHADAVGPVGERTGARLHEARAGERVGPLLAIATPGHTADHLAFVVQERGRTPGLHGGFALTGDAVLGEGSVFVVGHLAEYLDALRSLRSMNLAKLLPGHGPVVDDPAAKLDGYVAHRLERERKLVAALDAGARTVDEMLDAAWDDAPAALRHAAAATLGAHLQKLEAEGRLPAGVERPRPRADLRAP